MNNKTYPPTTFRGGRECPVCGKSSYSRNGIHPQCAILQADQPRQQQLAEDRKQRDVAVKKKKPAQTTWKKACPACKTEVHVRLKSCKCGHAF